ncbi:MAG: hypothetical protein M3R04_07465 [bacterium]|nr:hypothetical protein [bacterium]
MSSFEDSRYPRWDARFEETRHQAEEAIEEWYSNRVQQAVDNSAADDSLPLADAAPPLADAAPPLADASLPLADAAPPEPEPLASWFERAGEEIKVLYSDVKERILHAVGAEPHHDEEAHAEFRAAWDDDEHWQRRLRETAQKLEQEGRFGHKN